MGELQKLLEEQQRDLERDIERETAVERIAHRQLGFATLRTQHIGQQDFREVAVWCVKDALEEAYAAGFNAGRKEVDRKG